MRIGVKVGLLATVIACAAFAAAKAQEEKSYLPPTWFQDKGETSAPKKEAVVTPRVRAPKTALYRGNHVRRVAYRPKPRLKKRHVAVYHHHNRKVRLVYYRPHPRHHYYYPRYAYYRPAFPGFLFGLFHSW